MHDLSNNIFGTKTISFTYVKFYSSRIKLYVMYLIFNLIIIKNMN